MLKKKYFILTFLAAFIVYIYFSHKEKIMLKIYLQRNETNANTAFNYLKQVEIRDFPRYKCINRKRTGGRPNHIAVAPEPLWRIDGSWFVCFDKKLAPVKNDCNILSFGISSDDSFDYDFNTNYGCNVFSFDPIVEDQRFANIRKLDPKLKDSNIIEVNKKWEFYRIGIVGFDKQIQNSNKIGGYDTLNNLLKLTKLENQIVDVFKMDIEGGEYSVLENLDIDYACKYFKQFMLETHPQGNDATEINKLLRKLEKCFSLFHRDTRFFKGDTWGSTGHLTEYQNINGFSFNIKDYKTELGLANFIFSFGELYFINRNFID